jgi:hypothetical protein
LVADADRGNPGEDDMPRILTPRTFLAFTFGFLSANPATADYRSECIDEGCDTDELQELHDSYNEECVIETCSAEEASALAGGYDAINAMLDAFRERGWTVSEEDYLPRGSRDCSRINVENGCLSFRCMGWHCECCDPGCAGVDIVDTAVGIHGCQPAGFTPIPR